MFARSIYSSRLCVSGKYRFQSTVAASSTAASTLTENSNKNDGNKKPFNKPENHFIDSLYNEVTKDYTEFSPFFESVQQSFDKSTPREKNVSYRSMISCANKLLSKIDSIKKQTNTNVSTALLYKEIINPLIETKLIHSTHFNRYITSLLREKKFLEALTFWIENVSFFKNNDKVFSTNYNEKELKDSFYLLGLTSYLLLLVENKESKIDKEFIKLIYEDSKLPSYSKLKKAAENCNLSSNEFSQISEFYKNFKNENFDINSAESLKGIKLASTNGKLIYLENSIKNNLALYKGKEKEIKPSTISFYMKYLNEAKLYSQSIELFKFANENKIELNIDIWNQLLKSFSLIKSDETESRVESVWKLLQTNFILNSESYSIYLNYFLKTNQFNKANDIIINLKNNKPKLLNSDLKCAIVQYLLEIKHNNEALNLFKIYKEDENFTPNILIYNKLLSNLIYNNEFDEADLLLKEISSNKYKSIQPDIATWTTIIDFILKTSARARLSQEEIISKIRDIINNMKADNVKFNNIALITVTNNLLMNRKTHNLGTQLLEDITKLGVKLNNVGYSGVISSFADNNDMENALRYYKKAADDGILITPILYNLIFNGFSKYPNINATKEFLNEIKQLIKEDPKNNRLKPNRYTYYFLLKQATSVNDSKFIYEIINEIDNSDFKFSEIFCTTLLKLQSDGYTLPESLKNRILEFKKQ